MSEETDKDQKTEDPTQKRLDEALERGDVVKSQEVSTWFVIAGATLVLSSFSSNLSGLQAALANIFANAHRIPMDGHGLALLLQNIEYAILAALGVPLLMLMIAAFAGNVIQHRLVWSAAGISPKLSKISPLAGLKRLFSKQAVANFVKGLIKLALIGTVMTVVLWPERHRLDTVILTDPSALMGLMRSLSLDLLGTVVAVLAFVAAGDYFFQYRQWFEKQKMSLQEMKEEFKQTEGDPHIKGKLRQLRMAKSRKRMMQAVPAASVVIMNPTHYAVALKYERGMPAPICVAKGRDRIALKIRDIARGNGVPVIENPPLARALHATVEIDDEIPVEHYQAVAEVIGYVMKLRRGFGR